MTDILAKLTERRAQLMRHVEEHHQAELALLREQRVTEARLAEIEFAIVVIQDGAEVPRFEDVVQVEGEAATPQASGAENSSAGAAVALNGITLVTDVGEKPYHGMVPPPKKPRVSKLDIIPEPE